MVAAWQSRGAERAHGPSATIDLAIAYEPRA